MNIAVVGTGIIGASHLVAIDQSKYFTLCAVCDINMDSAETYARKTAYLTSPIIKIFRQKQMPKLLF